MKELKLFFVLSASLFYFNPVKATPSKSDNTNDLEIFNRIENGECAEIINEFQVQRNLRGHYFIAKCAVKNRQFKLAAESFQLAGDLEDLPENFYYEWGRVEFGLNQIQKAREHFEQSLQLNQMVSASHYYIAYISQLLEESQVALNHYKAVYEDPLAKDAFIQAALFNTGDILIGQQIAANKTENEMVDIIKNQIYPLWNLATMKDPQGPIVKEIENKKRELSGRYPLDPRLMASGYMLPEHPLSLNFKETFAYDSNVTLAGELPTVQTTDRDSISSETTLDTIYRFTINRKHVIAPTLRLEKLYYFNRSESEIYKNDGHVYAPSVKYDFHHFFNSRPTSLQLETNFRYQELDRWERGDLVFNNRSLEWTLGEKSDYFSFGPSIFKLKYKTLNSYNFAYNSKIYSLFLNQIHSLTNGHLLIYTFNFDFSKLEVNTQDSRTILLRGDYLVPILWNDYSLNGNLSLLAQDMINQPSRGMELTITPELKFNRTINKFLRINLAANFSYKKSKLLEYSYKRTKVFTEITVDF